MSASKPFSVCASLASLPAGFAYEQDTWLTLRHTAASLMFDAGLTLFEVQQRLGHKSPTMTAEVSTHLMRERFDEGRQRMEDYMLTKRRADPTDDPRRLGS